MSSYRGFSIYEISTLAITNGQAECLSKSNNKGLNAAIEWIDNFFDSGNLKEGRFFPKVQFEWLIWENYDNALVTRSLSYSNEISRREEVDDPQSIIENEMRQKFLERKKIQESLKKISSEGTKVEEEKK